MGAKQLKTETGSPAAFSITTEGGMLQTLLHAIELKNQEAATDKDDDKRSKVGQGEVVMCRCQTIYRAIKRNLYEFCVQV